MFQECESGQGLDRLDPIPTCFLMVDGSGEVVDDWWSCQTTPGTRTVMIWIRGRTSTCRVPCGVGVPGYGAGHNNTKYKEHSVLLDNVDPNYLMDTNTISGENNWSNPNPQFIADLF